MFTRAFLPLTMLMTLLTALPPVGAAAAEVELAPAANLYCQGELASIAGTTGPDTIEGTAQRDIIVAMGGADTIFGNGGDDLICAGAGDDIIEAGTGNDSVYAGAGHDMVLGQAGNDIIFLGTGDDRAYGDDGPGGTAPSSVGNDELFGGPGQDTLFGQDGNDRVEGGTGDDELEGGEGDDIVLGFNGADDVRGGNGDDKVVGGQGPDYVDGGAGDDDVRGEGGPDQMYGGEGDDRLTGGWGPDTIDAGPGDDRVDGGASSDIVSGGEGDDHIDGSNGDDDLSGDTGNDTIYGDANNDMIDGGADTDACTGGQGTDTLTACESEGGQADPEPEPDPDTDPCAGTSAGNEATSPGCPTDTGYPQCENLVSELSYGDCVGLVALYRSTGGPSWVNNTGWLQEPDPCDWFGVICDYAPPWERPAFGLILPSNGLQGELPDELGQATRLYALSLNNNGLVSELPRSWAALDVESLHLTGNCIDDSDALAVLGAMRGSDYEPGITCVLESPYPECDGQVAPMSAGTCEFLIDLYHSTDGDNWTGNRNWLSDIGICRWEGVACGPHNARDAGHALILTFQQNNLVGQIPVSIANARDVRELSLGGNPGLEGSLPGAAIESEITRLYLWGACVDDRAVDFAAWAALDDYQIGRTCLISSDNLFCDGLRSGIPAEGCEALVRLYEATGGSQWWRDDRWLTSSDPCGWLYVTCDPTSPTAVELVLRSNQLAGTLPDLSGLDVTVLDLSFNNMSGPLPASIADLPLTRLWLTGSCLPITNPATAAFVETIDYIGGTTCRMSSAVPACDGLVSSIPVSECEALVQFYDDMGGPDWPRRDRWLRRNDPCTWIGVTCSRNHVAGLDMELGGTGGEISGAVARLTNLFSLSLVNGGLTGGLPASWGELTSLRYIDVSDNSLTGSIPASWTSLDNVLRLDLIGSCIDDTTPAVQAWLAQLQADPNSQYRPGDAC